VPSLTSTTDAGSPGVGVRGAQRLKTRARVFDATVAKIDRSGLAGADVAAIAAAAGVARGTFYFHFPTKEHVLVELERAEQVKIVAILETHASRSGDLMSMLTLLVRQVLGAEQRLGPVVFRDMLGLHSPRRVPSRTSWVSIRLPGSSSPRLPRRRRRDTCPATPTRANSRRFSSPGYSRCWPLMWLRLGRGRGCWTGM